MTERLTEDPIVEVAAKIRAAMIECLEQRDGRYYATEAGCQRLTAILEASGIRAMVNVGADERFEVRPLCLGQ